MANPSAMEQSVHVNFYTDAVEWKFESEKQGRPIFRDLPFVRIIIPGDANNIIEREANDIDREKYPSAWARFQLGEKSGLVGMPLQQWPQITRAQLKEANYFEVHSVEQLAALADSHVQKLGMGFQDLRAKAKAYLELAADTASATKQAAENERLKADIADLKAQMASIAAASQTMKQPTVEEIPKFNGKK